MMTMPILGSNVGKLGSLGTSTVTRYVAPDGNDNAAGTFAAPYATIAKALTAAPTNATVYVYEGTYLEPLTITKPVKIRSYGSGDPVIRPDADGRASAVLIQANNVTLDGLVIDAVNRWRGIDINAAYVTIRWCEVKNCVATASLRSQGIIVGNNAAYHHVTIEDCIIHDVTGDEAQTTFCHAIYSACVAMIVRRCETYNCTLGYAIHWSGGDDGDLTAYDNYFHDGYAGVGIFNGTALIYNNVMRSLVLSMVARYGVQVASFYHNTIINGGNAIAPASLPDGAVVTYQNNILVDSTFAVHMERPTATTAQVIVDHNLRDGYTYVDHQGGFSSAYAVSHINADFTPVTDDGAANIKPTTGNPAINAGVTVASVMTDRGGNARGATPTLGAWEAA